MIFKQLFDQETWTYTYLIADPVTKEAMFIDPVNTHIDDYIALLEEHGLQLKYTLETHVHADHITASGLLRQRLGAQTAVSAVMRRRNGRYSNTGRRYFQIRRQVKQIKVIATPGHTAAVFHFYGATGYLPAIHCSSAAVAAPIFRAAMPVRSMTASPNACLPCRMKPWFIQAMTTNSAGSAASCRNAPPTRVWQAKPANSSSRS